MIFQTRSKSQIGAFSSLENAKKACKAGYAVFDSNGKQVYPVPKSYVRGTKIELKNTPLYISASASNSTKKSGIYYIYDGEAVNGRYRITTKPEYCGKTPVGKYVSGWVDKNSI